MDRLIDDLIVGCLTAHPARRAGLVRVLSAELRGPVYDPTRENRKKSELVEALAKLFADAAKGRLDDPKLAERLNG